MRNWLLDAISVGDVVAVRIVNKRGDRNLDGVISTGVVVEIIPSHSMAKLHTGWCVHTEDDLLEHSTVAKGGE